MPHGSGRAWLPQIFHTCAAAAPPSVPSYEVDANRDNE
jgi:hypothetical protein